MSPPNEQRLPTVRSRVAWPRPETCFLALSAVGTILAKYAAIRVHQPDHLLAEMSAAALSDVVFFAAVAVLFAAGLTALPRRAMARLNLVLAGLLAVWSLVNAAWLKATGVQLQPAVVQVAAKEMSASWDIVALYLARNLPRVIPLALLVLACATWFVWKIVRPATVPARRAHHAHRAVMAAGLLVVALAGQGLIARFQAPSVWGEAVGFSSHWQLLSRAAGDLTPEIETGGGRHLPRAGERPVIRPADADAPAPNVVVIFLESVFRQATSLHDAGLATTPRLQQLADEGTEFVSTRAPVPLTSSAFWATLTGNTPDLRLDGAETVLVDEPYDGLVPMLARHGYRSSFFQMATGTFEGTPGLIANLGFDWAWFRENLGDDSANLGYMCGDDYRLLDPMFDWVDGGEEPFVLTLITSVTHDPYELPDWYAHEPAEDAYGRFLQTVRFSDAFVGEVVDRLEERGLLERTLLCVIGDHGDSFRPEASRLRWAPFEEVIRVPWVVRWPGHVEAGRKVEWPCSQLDVLPTLLALLGFDISAAGFEGRDALVPGAPDRRLYFSSWYRHSPRGYLEADQKYVHWPFTGNLFRYDLNRDPGETSPVVVSGADRDRVLADLDEWTQATRTAIPAKRFRERLLYDHWQTMSIGRHTTTHFLP